MENARTPGQLVRLAVIAGWAIVLGCLFANAVRRVGGNTGDFVHFFEAARAMVEGRDIYTSGLGAYIYPPLLAFLYTPVARLGEVPAELILLLCNMALMAASALLAAREFAHRFDVRADLWTTAAIALAGVLLMADKIKGELQMWQTNMLLLFLFTLAFRLLDNRPGLAGVALGCAFNIKYWPIVLLPYLLLRRRWTAAGAFVVSIVVFALLPAVLTGWETNLHNQAIAYRGLFRVVGLNVGEGQGANLPSLNHAVSTSIPSAIARIPWAGGSPAIGYAGAGLVALAFFAAAGWTYRRHGVPFIYRPDGMQPSGQPARAIVALEWAGLLTAVLLFSPQTNSRNLSLLLFAQTLAALLLIGPRRGLARWPLFIGTAVLLAGLVLPPGRQELGQWIGVLFRGSVETWHGAGGPCWCALAMLATLLWVGLQHAHWLGEESQTPKAIPARPAA